MAKHLLVILSLFYINSCIQTYQLNNKEKQLIINEVTEMFNNYHNAIRNDGLIAEFNYLDQSPDFFWVPPGYNSALSYDSVRGILETNAKSFRSIVFAWDTLQVFPLTKAIANYSGIVAGSMVDTSGVISRLLLIESGTVIKRVDGWKILSGQTALLETDVDK